LAGDIKLFQSLAILEYLDEAYPEPPLLPADPQARAWVRQEPRCALRTGVAAADADVAMPDLPDPLALHARGDGFISACKMTL
jgi:glutathione S-transferase